MNFTFIKQADMYFVAVCPGDPSASFKVKPGDKQAVAKLTHIANPSFILEFLNSMLQSITDFCGGLDE